MLLRPFPNDLEVRPVDPVTMRNLNFGFFDDSGQPRESRILMFYSFETEERLARSGIMHYHLVRAALRGAAPRQ